MKMKRPVKAILSRLKFGVGLTPKIDKNSYSQNLTFVPSQYKAVVLISADFEMAWASRYTKNSKQPLEFALEKGRLTRKNVPVILDLCEKYNVPITWATVGHLFLDSCEVTNGIKHPEIKKLPFFENQFWKFSRGDWFDYDPCTDYKSDSEWYAPDLINDITSRKTEHEIGCHTFSHIDCTDTICSDEVFDSEIVLCKKLAEQSSIKLSSFVHPGHTIGHLKNLANHGFSCYRTDYCDTIGYPVWHDEGLWELQSSAQIEFRKDWSTQYQIYRLTKVVKRAIKSNTVCNLWFHPQIENEEFVNKVFEGLFRFLKQRNQEVWVTTMHNYISYLNNQML